MKNKATVKKRSRFETQIASAAQKDLGDALELARRGHIRTAVENAVSDYLHSRLTGGTTLTLKPFGEWNHKSAVSLCRLFLDAVDHRDGEALRAIAEAVKKFHYPAFGPKSDFNRWMILGLRQMLEESGKRMEIKMLAALLYGENIEGALKEPPTEDGHAKLRRLAKKLGFPIAKAKMGRPKKSDE